MFDQRRLEVGLSRVVDLNLDFNVVLIAPFGYLEPPFWATVAGQKRNSMVMRSLSSRSSHQGRFICEV